jgi:hypothetical protein
MCNEGRGFGFDGRVKPNRFLTDARRESICHDQCVCATRDIAGAVLLPTVVFRAVVPVSMANDRAVVSSGRSVVAHVDIYIACYCYPNVTGR